jgi:DNA-binding MarR family transcriptional regulator
MATLSWHEEGLRMSALSMHMKVSNGNVTGIVESLIREGLVLRKVAPDDKRAATVSLTSLGHQRFQQMALAHEEWVNGMFANLDSEQLDLLAGLLEQLGEDEE